MTDEEHQEAKRAKRRARKMRKRARAERAREAARTSPLTHADRYMMSATLPPELQHYLRMTR